MRIALDSTMPASRDIKVSLATPRTFELIGRIASTSAELEFVFLFCAKLFDKENKINVEEALGSRQKVVELTKNSFNNLQDSNLIPELPNIKKFVSRLEKLLGARDALVHGLLMNKEDLGLKMYQPRKKKWVDIDDAALEELLTKMQELSDEVLRLRTLVWNSLYPTGLIQLSEPLTVHQGAGARLS